MGTLGGTVQVLGYHSDTLIVNSHCYSKKIKDSKFTKNNEPADRDILGITIDPRDVEIRPYVSTSTLYWLDKKRLDNSPINWRNGAVDRLKPGTEMSDPKVCLVMDKRIISNLPVSNHDHSVNALMFDQKGDLLISVGGFTNMGLPGYKLGGYWETHLSAAVLIARTSLGDVFNGNLEYTTDLVRHAMLKKGDVEIFATGIRNGFAMTLTRNGNMYLADQGPNCAFGDTATDCDADYDEQRAKNWDPSAEINWQGLVKHGWNNCPYAVGRPDKVLHLSEGAYYGHPNVQRGLQIDESEHECYWVDPYTGLPADKKKKPSLFKYKKPLELFKSPVTGIAEYQASHFCSKLRGNLILSTYKDGKTYRLGVDGSKVTREGEKLSDHGGLTFVQNARGDLVFPRLSKKNVFVLRPDVSMRAELFVTGVAPVRHGKNGGTMITVAGQNFGMDPSVMVGGNSCAIAMSSKTEIKCMVPAGSGLVDVEVVAVEGESGTLANAVLYMEVG
ncbi:unnamed protein product [Chondrus crispus]|uniref:IPT/TIG domain-containing protein n=1 Tax=Chondrus crispus TaxID=2769 RepID=R7QT45_CHOCR|nr:unnamed protein product [Chondrus crispus]CDF40686.1 unnamed protein product [Chondrus crispus]|eukprot:XP_005710980.1 unnamed protein product [Chondrus crispus]